jgi:biopolymer transport protein ExbD
MRTSFCKIDPTANVRHFKYLPNIVPLCGILLIYFIIITPVFFTPWERWSMLPPKAKNDCLQDSNLIKVCVNYEGNMWLDGIYNSYRADFDSMLSQMLKEKNFPRKIILKAPAGIDFGTVQRALRRFQEKDIRVVGLLTNEYASFMDFIEAGKNEPK